MGPVCNKYEYKNSIFPAAMASLEKDGSTSTDVIPASLLKQLRAVAALISYDRITVQASMNLLEQQRRIHSIFHGNQETNMTSQLERLVALLFIILFTIFIFFGAYIILILWMYLIDILCNAKSMYTYIVITLICCVGKNVIQRFRVILIILSYNR